MRMPRRITASAAIGASRRALCAGSLRSKREFRPDNATGRSDSVQTWHGATWGLTLELPKMAIYNINMDISVTEFKHRCLEIIRRVEKTGKPVAITRRGKVVVRLNPSGSAGHGGLKPWEQLRSLGGRLLAEPGESVLHDEDFEALR